MKSVLVISSKPLEFDAEGQHLSDEIQLKTVSNRLTGQELILKERFDAFFIDSEFLQNEGKPDDFLFWIRKQTPSIPIIAITERNHVSTITPFVNKEVQGYLSYPFDVSEIDVQLDRLSESGRLIAEVEYLRDYKWDSKYREIVRTESHSMADIYQKVQDVSPTKSTVLLLGETGVGKGLIARLIHDHSERSTKPFIHVHCGAISENLVESELFGHEKGAFTGAVRRKLGKFDLARGGTLFLDEISTLTLSAQVKLLQVLQDSIFQRVGGENDIQSDVRIIAATNDDLGELSLSGSFRKDLFYRLNVFPINVPALRQRIEDIGHLIHVFIERLNMLNGKSIEGIQPEALLALKEYSWPGNIRELENLIERAYILEKSKILTTESFPQEVIGESLQNALIPLNTQLPISEARSRVIENFERQYIKEMLSLTHGRVTQAAENAGVGVRQFNKLMAKYDLKKEDFKSSDSK